MQWFKDFILFFILLLVTYALPMYAGAAKKTLPKKVFWVDSYTLEYDWSKGIERGILEGFKNEQIELSTFHMDTKPCKTSACMHDAAAKAKAAIDAFQPDLLIASDDNAQKYFVVPFIQKTSLPVVFCGVNWDASVYNYPSQNITGMIEVDFVRETVEHMRRFAKGDRIGYIGGDTTSSRKISNWLNQHFFEQKMNTIHVKTFSEFKHHFISIQNEVDMLFIRTIAGIDGWNILAAKKFIAQNLKIPTGSNNTFMSPYVIFSLETIPEEQGLFAAKTAIKILNGVKPGDIPVAVNQQTHLTVNLAMSRAADIVLPLSLLKIANVIGQEVYARKDSEHELTKQNFSGKRIAWIDSYHKGYEWSDGQERAIRETLFETGIELKIIRMNTKIKKTEEEITAAAKRAKEELDLFKPDIIIASDDNSQKFLIVPYYKNTALPVVFNGVNWDASMYGYPAPNVTGMVEVTPIEELIDLLRPFSRGSRIGYLAGDVATERKLANIYKERFFNENLTTYLVSSWDEFKTSFLRAQKEVDILFFSNFAGILDWDAKTAEEFILNNSLIPSGSDNVFMKKYVLLTIAKSPEEQGRYAALAALKILGGLSPKDIPLVTNRENELTVNLQFSQKAGFTFPISVLKKAQVIGQNTIE